MPGIHAMWERGYGHGSDLGMENPDLAREYNQYIVEYGNRNAQPTPDDRRYLDVHEGHYVYLKKGEGKFVSPDLIARTLTGTGEEISERLDELEASGVNNVALSAVNRRAALDMIKDFGNEVIQRR